MSLKPLQTHITAVSSLYAPYTASGGGGGGGPAVTTSSLVVSSITGVASEGPYFTNGLEIGAAGELSFEGGLGVVIGISSINSAPYPPAGLYAPLSTPLITATIGSVPLAITQAPFPTKVGSWYQVQMEIDDMSFTGTMGANDSLTIEAGSPAGTNALALLDLPRLSTLKGGGAASIGLACVGPIESLSTFVDIIATPNTGIGTSTFMTTAFRAWLTPLTS